MLVVSLLICHLVSRRRQSEDELRAQKRFRLAVEDSPSGVIIVDEKGRIDLVNPQAERLFGYAKSELAGQPVEILVPIRFRDRHPDFRANFAAAPEARPMGAGRELYALHKDRTEIPVEIGITPVNAPEGQVVLNIVDITERKKAQDALREADRHKNEFLAMLAHELRNPLAPIRYAIQIIKATSPKEPHLERLGEIIDRQVSHMAHLLDDLLDVSRITRGKIRLKKEELDLRTVIDQALDISEPQVQRQNLELTYFRPPEPMWVEGDLTRLVQVVSNLLGNAIKYNEEGGAIRVSLEQGALPGGSKNGMAIIQVCDSGIGITPEMLPRIFEPFVQGEQSLERPQGGLGIGLSMVQHLVNMHGGSVSAFSEGLNKGSEFTVRLPLISQTDKQAQPMTGELAKTEKSREISCKILVLEDNVDAANALAELLQLWGHQTRVAYDGASGVAAAVEFLPDLVLLDIGLPELDGYEVARRLHNEPSLESMVLIALTGYGQDDDRQRTRLSGFDWHLTKPVNIEELRALITRLPNKAI